MTTEQKALAWDCIVLSLNNLLLKLPIEDIEKARLMITCMKEVESSILENAEKEKSKCETG